jgi:hypothetical protein
MNTSHTPGPWMIGTRKSGDIVIVCEKSGDGVAIMCSGAERDSDAKLIAAAPCLLLSLLELVKHAEPISKARHDQAWLNARRAIEAAGGEL